MRRCAAGRQGHVPGETRYRMFLKKYPIFTETGAQSAITAAHQMCWLTGQPPPTAVYSAQAYFISNSGGRQF